MPNRSIQKPQATCGTRNIGTREKDARTTERKKDRIKALPRAVFLSWLAFIGKHGMLHASDEQVYMGSRMWPLRESQHWISLRSWVLRVFGQLEKLVKYLNCLMMVKSYWCHVNIKIPSHDSSSLACLSYVSEYWSCYSVRLNPSIVTSPSQKRRRDTFLTPTW